MKLTIRQVENPRPGQLARTLTLDGSLAPLDSLAFGVSQRAEIEWLHGSDVAAVQLSGSEEAPTEARLVWKGRRFRVGEAQLGGVDILDMDTLVEVLSDMVRDPALVDVTWRGRTQRAVLQAFTPEEGRAFEYEATLTFAWVAPPSGAQRSTRRPPPSHRSFAAKLQASFDEAMAWVEKAVTFLRGPVDAAERDISQVRANLRTISDAARSVVNVQQSYVGVVKSIADAIQQVIRSTQDIEDDVAGSSDQIAQTDDAYMQIRARLWRSSTGNAARVARRQAALERRNYRPESDVLAVHEGVDGDTIWSVARLWYGTPTLGPAIARRNNLISTAIRTGQRIVIPARAGAA